MYINIDRIIIGMIVGIQRVDIMNNEDKILMILEQMKGYMKEMQGDMKLVKTQLKEQGELLGSLKTASKFHKADIDNLTHQVANMSSELKAELKETNLK